MSWKTSTIDHDARIRMGLSMNDYVLLDYIYRTQTHPDYGGKIGGWCETTLDTMSEFFGISKGGLSGIIKKLSSDGFIELLGNKRRTTGKWFSQYRTDVQKVNSCSESEQSCSESEQDTLVYKEEIKEEGDSTSGIRTTKAKEKAKRNGAVSLPPAREDFAGFANPDMAMEIWAEWVEYKWEQHKEKYKHKKSEQLMIAKLLQYSGGSIQKARAIIHDAMAKIYKGFFPYEDRMAASAVVPERKIPEDTYQLPDEMQKRYEAATKWFYEKCHLCAGIRWLSKQEYEKIQNKDSDFIGAMWYAHCVSTEFGKKVQESLLALNQLPRWDKDKWQSVYEWLKKDVSDRIFPHHK